MNEIIMDISLLAMIALPIAGAIEGAVFGNDKTAFKLLYGWIASTVLYALCFAVEKLRDNNRTSNSKNNVLLGKVISENRFFSL